MKIKSIATLSVVITIDVPDDLTMQELGDVLNEKDAYMETFASATWAQVSKQLRGMPEEAHAKGEVITDNRIEVIK